MHRTLKGDACTPPASSWSRQQAVFDDFVDEYNRRRPHEGIDQRFPAQLYQPSPRPYPEILPQMTCPDDMLIRAVKRRGDISWINRHVYLAETVAGELVGLQWVDDDPWDVYFGPIRLAQLDATGPKLIHLKRTRSRSQRNQPTT